ncbi:MAG TPA: arylesterase [Methylomirabilota bacterium]|nr:arylesterase [Methylomirabilota bacterium]
MAVAGLLLALLSAPSAMAAEPLRILAFGDSLTAGFGLPDADGFVPQLQSALADKGITARVINAGVSGDTTAGGLARLDWALADDPQLVIVELGANDGLRGLDPKTTAANLDGILAKLEAQKRAVLLAGMKAPRNLGTEYTTAFDAIYPELAARHKVTLYPFFLDGVATDPQLNQEDGIHPNAAGVKVVVGHMLPYVLKAIDGIDRTAGQP